MTADQAAYIGIADHPGEFRAVMFDGQGRPWRVFSERWNGQGSRARIGERFEARLTAFAETQGGAFLKLSSGEDAFMNLKSRDGLTEGQTVAVYIAAEARRDKLAKVRLFGTAPPVTDHFEAWLKSFPNGLQLPQRDDETAVDSAFEDALLDQVTLPRGGRLFIERTRALTAFDIDTAGRYGKGSAGARAMAVNRDAATEMIRQAALRDLGGLLVLDCVAPLNRAAEQQIRDAAAQACAFAFTHAPQINGPSRFGLLEVALPWTRTPIMDLNEFAPFEARLLALMRKASRQAAAFPARLVSIKLTSDCLAAYALRRNEVDQALLARFGGRVVIEDALAEKDEVVFR